MVYGIKSESRDTIKIWWNVGWVLMSQEITDNKNKLLLKENIWFSCIKATLGLYATWLYLINNFIHKSITDFLQIKYELVAIVIIFIPIVILRVIVNNYFTSSFAVVSCFPKQCFTVGSILFYVSNSILWTLEKGFHEENQIFLTAIVVLSLVITWRKEIFNKLRRTN